MKNKQSSTSTITLAKMSVVTPIWYMELAARFRNVNFYYSFWPKNVTHAKKIPGKVYSQKK